MIEIQDGKASEETIIFINETTECDLDNDGKLWDSEGFEPWPYIPNKTFALSDLTNSFTLGYVYTK